MPDAEGARLLLRRDLRAHRVQLDQGEPLADRGAPSVLRMLRRDRVGRAVRALPATAVRGLRRARERRGRAHRALASRVVPGLPRGAARLPHGAVAPCGAGAARGDPPSAGALVEPVVPFLRLAVAGRGRACRRARRQAAAGRRDGQCPEGGRRRGVDRRAGRWRSGRARPRPRPARARAPGAHRTAGAGGRAAGAGARAGAAHSAHRRPSFSFPSWSRRASRPWRRPPRTSSAPSAPRNRRPQAAPAVVQRESFGAPATPRRRPVRARRRAGSSGREAGRADRGMRSPAHARSPLRPTPASTRCAHAAASRAQPRTRSSRWPIR